jgi:hypothetical protein
MSRYLFANINEVQNFIVTVGDTSILKLQALSSVYNSCEYHNKFDVVQLDIQFDNTIG